jgi:hypothetical protein
MDSRLPGRSESTIASAMEATVARNLPPIDLAKLFRTGSCSLCAFRSGYPIVRR